MNDVADKAVAFFDFDGTLTTGDTLMPFLRFVVGRPVYYIKLLVVGPVLLGYFCKLLRNDVAKTLVLRFYLRGYSQEILTLRGKAFAEQIIPRMLRSEGVERMKWHRSQGHHCVLVSASMDVYLDHWSRAHGMSLICSRLAVEDEFVTGKLEGENCFGAVKLEGINRWLMNKAVDKTFAYGDTKGDYPMLGMVDEGYLWTGKTFERFIEN